MADSLWIRLIHARRVTGCHAAPPCETFTAARWLPAPEGLKPRPLRDSDFPWCKTFISLSEVAQCITGNLLMYKALFLVLLVHIHGGSTTLEHPRGDPSDARKWCIWDAAFLRELLLDRDFDLLPFLQGPLGRPFSKPKVCPQGFLKPMIMPGVPPRYLVDRRMEFGMLGRRKNIPSNCVKSWRKLTLTTPNIWSTMRRVLFRKTFLKRSLKHFDPYSVSAKGNVMANDYHRSSMETT